MPVSNEGGATVVGRDTVRAHAPKGRMFLAGDRVVVRSAQEILATLDADGTLHGLPFMPEMLDWCGKPFHVERRAEKTCVKPAFVWLTKCFPSTKLRGTST